MLIEAEKASSEEADLGFVGQVASIYGESYNQADAEQDVFFNKSEKRRRIMAQEAATFGGSSRGATGSAERSGY